MKYRNTIFCIIFLMFGCQHGPKKSNLVKIDQSKIFHYLRNTVERGLSSKVEEISPAEKEYYEYYKNCIGEDGSHRESCLIDKVYKCKSSEKINCDRSIDGLVYPVSILSISDTAKLVQRLSRDDFNDKFYSDIASGCHPRAFYIATILSKLSSPIFTGNMRVTAYGSGDLFKYKGTGWGSHIAPYFYMRVNNELQKFVIDPATVPEKFTSYENWIIGFNPDKVTVYKASLGPLFHFNDIEGYQGNLNDEIVKKMESMPGYYSSLRVHNLKEVYKSIVSDAMYTAASD